jgi:hypothetical protein
MPNQIRLAQYLLLLLLLCGNANLAQAQVRTARRVPIEVYPNPAAEYISLSEDVEVEKLVIINILGRTVREMPVDSTTNKYYIGDLPRGMFLLRIEGKNRMALQTMRLNKVNP